MSPIRFIPHDPIWIDACDPRSSKQQVSGSGFTRVALATLFGSPKLNSSEPEVFTECIFLKGPRMDLSLLDAGS